MFDETADTMARECGEFSRVGRHRVVASPATRGRVDGLANVANLAGMDARNPLDERASEHQCIV